MKSIVIASKNPVKARATIKAFKRMFPEESFRLNSVSVPSGVGRQPASDDETLQGAATRARNASREFVNANYWVGIEGGITEKDGDMAAFAWVVVLSEDQVGKSRTGTFFLPRDVADLVRGGKELGEADDIVFGQINSKQESGAIGLLTREVVDRTALYEHAVLLALVPFKNPELYNR
jgi:inosine/xanthosine triphosphatase